MEFERKERRKTKGREMGKKEAKGSKKILKGKRKYTKEKERSIP